MVRKNDEKQSEFLDSPAKTLLPQNNDSINNPSKVASQSLQNNASQLGKTNVTQNPSKAELSVPNPNKTGQAEVKNNEDLMLERDLAMIFRKYDTKKIIEALSRLLARP